MPTLVTDPALLSQLNGASAVGSPVTDPAVLAQLNAPALSPAQQRYDAAIQGFRAANPNATDADIEALKKQYSPDLMHLAQSGTTFGLSDELTGLAGGLHAMFSGQDFGSAYKRWSELESARNALAREQTGLGGQAVELGTSLAAMGPERAGLELLVNGGKAAVNAAPSLLRTILEGSGTGAALGGANGFTSTDGDLGQRLVGAAAGGVTGAVVGGALPVVTTGASKVVQAIMDNGATKTAAKSMGVSPDAARFIQTRLAADDALSPSGVQRIAQAGPEGTLADAGPSARNTLDYAVQSSGNAGRTATQLIGDRVSRDAQAINDALDRHLGLPEGVDTSRAAIRQASAPARDAAYKTAYAQPIDYASEDGRQIEELLQRVPQQAINRANTEMKIAGEKSSQIMAQVADDGTVTFKTMPDVRQLDYITRALNDEAKDGIGAGAMGGQTSLGAKLSQLSGEIRDTLQLHVPEYGDALAVGQDTIRQSQAVKNGYDLLSPATTREDVAAWSHAMTPVEQKAAAQGIRSRISDAVSNVTRTLTDGDIPAREALKTLRDLSSTASRDKVASVIGPQEADQLFSELDRATKSFELRASVADNSKTFQRQEMNRQVDAITNPQGAIHALGRGEGVNAVKRVVQAVTGLTPERSLAAKDALMQDVVKVILERGQAPYQSLSAATKLNTARESASNVAAAIVRNRGASGLSGYLLGGRSGPTAAGLAQ